MKRKKRGEKTDFGSIRGPQESRTSRYYPHHQTLLMKKKKKHNFDGEGLLVGGLRNRPNYRSQQKELKKILNPGGLTGSRAFKEPSETIPDFHCLQK